MSAMVPQDQLDQMKKEEMLRQYQALYQHLPPLPSPLPYPAYWPSGHDVPTYTTEQPSRDFYAACAKGNLDECRAFVERERPSAADLSYALEEASHSFQVNVVRYLLKEAGAQLHFRCFRRNQHHPRDIVENFDTPTALSPSMVGLEHHILATDRPELYGLLAVFLEDRRWHPNQLLGPLQKGKMPPRFRPLQEVALHYPRCLSDISILTLLLDAGADPTIARERVLPSFIPLSEMPTIRLSGYILEMAVNVGTPECVDLLLSHGARLDSADLLHSLARCADTTRNKKHPLLTPEAFYPRDVAARLAMARHLVRVGEDVNGWKNIYSIVSRHSVWSLPGEWMATPLYHAVLYQDWDYVQWLLENGADPNGFPQYRNHEVEMWAYPVMPKEADEMFQQVLGRFLRSREAQAA